MNTRAKTAKITPFPNHILRFSGDTWLCFQSLAVMIATPHALARSRFCGSPSSRYSSKTLGLFFMPPSIFFTKNRCIYSPHGRHAKNSMLTFVTPKKANIRKYCRKLIVSFCKFIRYKYLYILFLFKFRYPILCIGQMANNCFKSHLIWGITDKGCSTLVSSIGFDPVKSIIDGTVK